MKAFRLVLAGLGLIVVFLGLVFIIGGRAFTGGAILVTGLFLTVYGVRSAQTRNVVLRRELELTGDVSLQDMKCTQCGGALSAESISVRAGTVFVTCPYCHAEYQIEEAPKW
ncbi:MAG: hypothetical protein AVO35_05780 [Candidatus Aegiribacteria sp. MLS_C]|nr:MAG: hypothetical protein AVO35_05780 [Candidatus Aegiribacteria sp. MLS_C]